MSTEPRIERRAATEYAKKNERIKGFIRSVREIYPLLSGLTFDQQPVTENGMVELTEIVQKHNRHLEYLIDSFNLDPAVPEDSILISMLGTELSKIEKVFRFPEGRNPLIKELVTLLTEFTVNRKDLPDLQRDIAFNADIVACVKTSLFRSAYEFSQLLDGLMASKEEKERWLKWYHSTSVSLGKDVAFNFDQHGSFRDREILFRECLPLCTQLAVEEWKKLYLKSLQSFDLEDSSEDFIEASTIVDKMPLLNASIEKQHMGYKNHQTTDVAWLKKQIGYMLFGIIESYNLSFFRGNDCNKIKVSFASSIEKKCVDAWNVSCEETIKSIKEKLSAMTEHEIEEWKVKEGSNPMPFSTLKKNIMRQWEESKSLLAGIEMSEEVLSRNSRASLANLWGLSDAYCRIKTEVKT